jgi:hypothetical protein
MTTTPTNNYVMTTDGSGNGSWQANAALGGVTGIIGTANQVLANGTSSSTQTGIVTLSIATTSNVQFAKLGLGVAPLNALDVNGGMAVGSYAGVNTPPTNGAIISGKLGIGSSSVPLSEYIRIAPSFSTDSGLAAIFRFTGSTLTATASNDTFNIIRIGAPTLATGASSFTGMTYVGVQLFSPTLTGNGVFLNAYGFYSSAIASIATNQYAGYFIAPTGGTVNIAAYAANLSVGYTTPTPPSSGAQISGAVTIGTTTVDGSNKLTVSGGISASTLKMSTSPTNGYVMTTDSSGNGSWQAVGAVTASQWPIITVLTSYTASTSDCIILVGDTTAPRTITLPACNAAGDGKIYVIKDISNGASGNNITVNCTLPGAFDASLSYTINTNYGEVKVVNKVASLSYFIIGKS